MHCNLNVRELFKYTGYFMVVFSHLRGTKSCIMFIQKPAT